MEKISLQIQKLTSISTEKNSQEEICEFCVFYSTTPCTICNKKILDTASGVSATIREDWSTRFQYVY